MIDATMMIAAASLLGLCVVAFALLRAWQGWLELKREELERSASLRSREASTRASGSPEGAARIELADLKERIRKLEAIASGVEL